MTKYSFFFILSASLVLLILPVFAAADSDRGDRVCIYKHENFRGHEKCYRPGEEVSDLKHAEISSIRVFGHARAAIYEDRDFRGNMMEFTGDIPDLKHDMISGSKDWSRHAGSLRVTSDYAYDKGREFDKERPSYGVYVPDKGSEAVEEGVCVYEKPNYEGRSQCWGGDTHISNLKFPDWNDRISSVRVFGHAELSGYKDKDFRGERILIDHDVPDLGELATRTAGNWNHEISSLEVRAEAE